MPRHLSQELADRYRRRAMPAPELIATDQHLASCGECREMLANQEGLNSQIDSLRADLDKSLEDAHVDYSRLEAYVDQKLSGAERQALDSHFRSCASCSEELQDLQALRNELEALEVTSSGGEAMAADVTGRRPRKMFSFAFPGGWRVAGAWALAACALIAIAAGIRWAWERQHQPKITGQKPGTTTTPRPQVAKLPETTQINYAYLPPKLQTIVGKAIETQHIHTRDIFFDTLSLSSGFVPRRDNRRRGESQHAFPLLNPVETFVDSKNPVFQWDAIPGASGYIVRVSDVDENPVESSPALTNRSWKSTVALRRGKIYMWRVAVIRDGVEVKESVLDLVQGRFRVLDEPEARKLRQLKRTHPHEHFVCGVLLAHAGVLEEAVREFSAVPPSDPNYEMAKKFEREAQDLLVRRTAGSEH